MKIDMNRKFYVAEWTKRIGLLLVVSGIVFAGCQGALLSYKGAKVRTPYRIALSDGTQKSAHYQSPDLTIDYQILRNGDELRVSGVVEYTPKITNTYTLIPYFHLSLLLTDQYGNILQEKGLMTPGSNDPNNKMRVSEKIHLPSGTAYMAFSYSGEARCGGRQDGGGGAMSFWEVPIVR
jgi:hypothetical protein